MPDPVGHDDDVMAGDDRPSPDVPPVKPDVSPVKPDVPPVKPDVPPVILSDSEESTVSLDDVPDFPGGLFDEPTLF